MDCTDDGENLASHWLTQRSLASSSATLPGAGVPRNPTTGMLASRTAARVRQRPYDGSASNHVDELAAPHAARRGSGGSNSNQHTLRQSEMRSGASQSANGRSPKRVFFNCRPVLALGHHGSDAAIYCLASGCARVGACGCALACDDAGFGTGLRVPMAACAGAADVLGRRFC
jgi:hypothetical protein